MPYLRLYDDAQGAWEVELKKDRTVVGRSYEKADIVIEDLTVSRAHTVISSSPDGYLVEDAGSSAGTILNGENTPGDMLAHGDTLQLGDVVLEFRTDDGQREKEAGADATASGANALFRQLRQNHKLLPTGIRLRYRVVQVDPHKVFIAGDTLNIAGGGILLPCIKPLPESTVIEAELTPPKGEKRSFLGEVKAVLMDKNPPSMCIKLHNIKTMEDILRRSQRGQWVHGWPIEEDRLGATIMGGLG